MSKRRSKKPNKSKSAKGSGSNNSSSKGVETKGRVVMAFLFGAFAGVFGCGAFAIKAWHSFVFAFGYGLFGAFGINVSMRNYNATKASRRLWSCLFFLAAAVVWLAVYVSNRPIVPLKPHVSLVLNDVEAKQTDLVLTNRVLIHNTNEFVLDRLAGAVIVPAPLDTNIIQLNFGLTNDSKLVAEHVTVTVQLGSDDFSVSHYWWPHEYETNTYTGEIAYIHAERHSPLPTIYLKIPEDWGARWITFWLQATDMDRYCVSFWVYPDGERHFTKPRVSTTITDAGGNRIRLHIPIEVTNFFKSIGR